MPTRPVKSLFLYKILLCLAAILLTSQAILAQSIHGVVLDKASKIPLVNASVSSKKGMAFTNGLGQFSLPALRPGDTLNVTYLGYKTFRWVIGYTARTDTIYMEPNLLLLKEVSIQNQRNFKLDSLRIREQYAVVFANKGGSLQDALTERNFFEQNKPIGFNTGHSTSELVSINLLSVLALINKNHTQTSNLQKVLLRDESETYIDEVFSKQKVTDITALKGDSLQSFMARYRPNIAQAKKMNGYDMSLYIKKSYQEFVTLPPEAVKSPFGK